MAINIEFRKSAESETEVEYHYGDLETELNIRLVTDKASPAGPAMEGPDDLGAVHVIRRVLTRHKQTGIWPTGGLIQN